MAKSLTKKQKAARQSRILIIGGALCIAVGALVTVSTSAHAQAGGFGQQMLPPTVMNSNAACPPGGNQMLSFSGVSYNGTGGSGSINCVPVSADGSGNLSAAGNLSARGTVQVGNSNATCSPQSVGAIQYNPNGNFMEWCNGSSWQTFGGTGYPVNHGIMNTPGLGFGGRTYWCSAYTDANANIYLELSQESQSSGWQNTNNLTYSALNGGGNDTVTGDLVTCSADTRGAYIIITAAGGGAFGEVLLNIQPPARSFVAW